MKQLVLAACATLCATSAFAEDAKTSALEIWRDAPMTVFSAEEIDLSAFLWQARPVVIFANTAEDLRFQTQLENLLSEEDDVVERDIVIITDTDPAVLSPIRTALRPRDFHMVLIGKDGDVKLRKPRPWDMRELSRAIDKMPMRKREMGAQ
ncbi:MAG: DUF4174 domain-containing protein [Pseudomonadota bacterium]